MAASWALARVAISINPALYPRRTGSGPEGMIKPMLTLIDEAENELQQFEACLTLTNLATVPELRDRIVKSGGWRILEMCLTCENELVQRGAHVRVRRSEGVAAEANAAAPPPWAAHQPRHRGRRRLGGCGLPCASLSQ